MCNSDYLYGCLHLKISLNLPLLYTTSSLLKMGKIPVLEYVLFKCLKNHETFGGHITKSLTNMIYML